MKYNHNKKRNTALLYEMLVREMTRAIMNENIKKKQKISRLFKQYFHKNSVLGKEYAIYKSLNESRDLSKVLSEAKRQYSNVNKKQVFDTQTKLISEINKFIGRNFWSNYVSDYQWSATIKQAIAQDNNPKKQIMLEKKVMEIFPSESNKKHFPKVNKLAVNTFVNKFNQTYKSQLTESQCALINKFILSPADDGLEFRCSLYEEIDLVKGALLTTQKKIKDKHLVEKIDHVINRLDSFKNQKASKSVLTSVLQIQTLVEELNS